MPPPRIYLDHAASTPLAPEARAAMRAALDEFGNPSSPHAEGRGAKDALERARTRVSRALGCRPREVIFTPSGTYASQIGVRGVARARRERSSRVVLSAIEHPAVGDAARALEAEGFDIRFVKPNAHGAVEASRFLDTVGDDAAVAALMLVNHETGVRQPVEEVGGELRRRGVPLLCDACLGAGRTSLDLPADLLVLSAHKVGGPAGAGILRVRRGVAIEPLLLGGLQEERLTPGTESVITTTGCAVALEAALGAHEERSSRYTRLEATFLRALATSDGWRVIGEATTRVPGVLALEIPGVEGEAAMINLDLEGIAVSTGSACALGGTDPSPSLLAMGFTSRRAASTLRISFGEGVGDDDAARAGTTVAAVLDRLRALGRPRGGRT